MRKGILTTVILALGSVFLLHSAWAQMMSPQEMMQQEMMQNIAKQQQSAQQGQQNYPAMMGSYDMMGGYGYGPHMKQGYGMGPSMMGAYGMGPGMMGGYGMGYGMKGGHGYCQGPGYMWNDQSDEYNKFMEETKDTRKKLHDLHFSYGEIMRNPNTTVKELRDMEKEMNELREKLRKKTFAK